MLLNCKRNIFYSTEIYEIIEICKMKLVNFRQKIVDISTYNCQSGPFYMPTALPLYTRITNCRYISLSDVEANTLKYREILSSKFRRI